MRQDHHRIPAARTLPLPSHRTQETRRQYRREQRLNRAGMGCAPTRGAALPTGHSLDNPDSFAPFDRFAPESHETSVAHESFLLTMKLERDILSASELNTMDRRVIRVDMTPTQAGITAALRRAVEAAATEPCDRDFDDLLRRLN
jgi:hypothetical protein